MPLRDDLLTPIPGADPAGPYLRYDPLYDKLKDARRDDPLQDPPVRADWRQVADLASETLAKKSKDLQLAAWLTEAQLNREGYAGLRQGLELIWALLDQFWDTVHPVIEDGDADMRAAPLGWVGSYLDVPVRLAPVTAKGHSFASYRESRSVPTDEEARSDEEKRTRREAALADGRQDPDEFDGAFAGTPKAWYKQLVTDVDASIELVKKLEALGDERFGEAAPGYKPLRDALAEVRVGVVALLKRKLELEPDPIDEPTMSLDEPGGGDVAGEPGTLSAEPRSRDDAANRIAGAARYLRRAKPTDPAPYLLVRGFRWGELRSDGDSPNPRLLAAPPTEIRTRLKGMLLDGRWADLLDAAEEVMATPFGRGWLDLQRYVLTACEALGAEYGAVTTAIRGALRSLLRDLPMLLDATLMDDSPTANAETRGWLRAQGVLGGSDEDDAEEAMPSPGASGALDRSIATLRTSQPQRAIELLLRAAAQEKSERAKFMRRSDAAGIMVTTGLEPVAMPILQELVEQIEKHALEEWESGETVARALGLLWQCMTRLDQDYDTRQALYLRVCRLDPLQAMKFVENTETATDDDSGA